MMVGEIERGFLGTVIPESKFETFVEIGEIFNQKSGKIFITEDSLVFKPHGFNKSLNQPFERIFFKDISSASIERTLFGNEKIRLSVKQQEFLITPLEDCAEVVKYMKLV
jgi:hypothetical protein